jgi:hypothetical protein
MQAGRLTKEIGRIRVLAVATVALCLFAALLTPSRVDGKKKPRLKFKEAVAQSHQYVQHGHVFSPGRITQGPVCARTGYLTPKARRNVMVCEFTFSDVGCDIWTGPLRIREARFKDYGFRDGLELVTVTDVC